MPRTSRSRPRKAAPANQYYVFEIGAWELEHLLSVNSDRYRDGPYNEHLTIEFTGTCVHPEALKGRTVRFDIAGKRDMLQPEVFQRDPEWKPRCIGALETNPSGGWFYFSVPHDSMACILTAFAHGLFRYVSLWGPALKRGKSLCTSVHLLRSVDLNEL